MSGFRDLGLSPGIQQALDELGYEEPTPIQAQAIPELLAAVAAGELEVVIGETYPLSEARRAHEDIAARQTHGKLLLDPSR